MSFHTPRPLYQTDQDAQRIQAVLDLRTTQLKRANDRTKLMAIVALACIGILVGVVA